MVESLEKLTHSSLGPAALMARVVVLSHKMLEYASAGDWDSVTRLEYERRTVIRDCFDSKVETLQTELFSEALSAVLSLNEEVIAMLENAKADISIKRTDQKYTSRSVGHYLDVKYDA